VYFAEYVTQNSLGTEINCGMFNFSKTLNSDTILNTSYVYAYLVNWNGAFCTIFLHYVFREVPLETQMKSMTLVELKVPPAVMYKDYRVRTPFTALC